MDYLLKASAILLIFYVCYQLFLQRDTFFQVNRLFLLSGLILASCIPLVVIPNYIEYTTIDTSGFTYHTSSVPIDIKEEPYDYLQLMSWTYLAGITFFFGKLCIEFLSLRKILNTSKPKSSGEFKIIETVENVAPFSFFNHIVYNPNQFKDEELSHVINHEKVHTQEWHSIDTIVAQFACILFWFNPIVWLYKKALQQNLEFIADQKAQYISECNKSYQTVLLKASVKNHQLAITNNFYTSLIKKRIVMLHKSKSNKLNQLKIIAVLPLLTLFMMSFNIEDVYVEIPSEDTKEKENTLIPQSGDIEIVITKDTTDEQLQELQNQLKSKGITLTYTNVKRNSNSEITSIKTDFKSDNHSSNYNIKGDDGIKSFRFKSSNDSFSVGTIDKDSNVKTQSKGSNIYISESDEDEESSHSDVESDEHNTSVVYRTKTWTDKNGEKISVNATENGNTNIWISKSEEPLFVIDGKIVKKPLFEDIDSDDIQSINILKGKTAIQSFGERGKNGVVMMTKKGSNNLFVEQKTEFRFESDGKEPLYIIDGKIVSTDELKSLNPNNIISVDVLKDKSATKTYGSKGKNGVVLISSKANEIVKGYRTPVVVEGRRTFVVEGEHTPVAVEVEELSPWQTKTAMTSVYFTNDDGHTETIEFIISKNSSDAFLDTQKNGLKKHGIDVKFNKVRRNDTGEITSIKISLDDNDGRKSSASWKEKSLAIPDIVIGKSKDDKLFIRAIGN